MYDYDNYDDAPFAFAALSSSTATGQNLRTTRSLDAPSKAWLKSLCRCRSNRLADCLASIALSIGVGSGSLSTCGGGGDLCGGCGGCAAAGGGVFRIQYSAALDDVSALSSANDVAASYASAGLAFASIKGASHESTPLSTLATSASLALELASVDDASAGDADRFANARLASNFPLKCPTPSTATNTNTPATTVAHVHLAHVLLYFSFFAR